MKQTPLPKIVVIANREPVIHQRTGDKIATLRPASGVVAALEPVLRHHGGLWIAHGSGNADREMSSPSGVIHLPLANPSYTLKRVWLSEEEEAGYYYGFANEGLWPLCHLAHQRPLFRLSDWQQYGAVNQRFCNEIPPQAFDGSTVFLIQDYHFSLLPRMLKLRASAHTGQPKVNIFWHIPWPNPETFGICPWHREILAGMLGADLIGFHTQFYCNNFLETCDRYLETRIDWANFSVTMDNHRTLVRAFPIGIEAEPVRQLSLAERSALKAEYGITAEIVAVGVDRIDYTKGLLERIDSVERFLEKHPEYIGRFTLAQLGAPSRTSIPSYRELSKKLHEAIERVNLRFATTDYKPIMFFPYHHDWDAIQYFYQLGDLCMVTSLHDGMNLVAKEYVWCQSPDRGNLILSKFAGASNELSDAIIVNPYATEEVADAILLAIQMPQDIRLKRMQSMRDKITRHNAFNWASNIIHTLSS